MLKKMIRFAVLVLACLFIVSCSNDDSQVTNTENTDIHTIVIQAESTNINTTESENEDIPFLKYDSDTFEISTPFVPLYYPVKWKDNVKVESFEVNGNYEVNFTALLEDKTLPLYSIIFGNVTNGYELGYIEYGSEKLQVFLFDYMMTEPGLMSEDNKAKYFEMAEDINVIISKLIYEDGMILN